MDSEYEKAWREDGANDAAADPAVSAVKAAAVAERSKDAEEFSQAFSQSSPNESSSDMVTDPKVPVTADKPAAPKEKSFKDAFKEARAAGEKVFTWSGKKYTTEMAKPAAPVAKSLPAAAPAAKADESAVPAGLKGKDSLADAMKGTKHAMMGTLSK